MHYCTLQFTSIHCTAMLCIAEENIGYWWQMYHKRSVGQAFLVLNTNSLCRNWSMMLDSEVFPSEVWLKNENTSEHFPPSPSRIENRRANMTNYILYLLFLFFLLLLYLFLCQTITDSFWKYLPKTFFSKTLRAREITFLDNVHPSVACHLSHVTYHV